MKLVKLVSFFASVMLFYGAATGLAQSDSMQKKGLPSTSPTPETTPRLSEKLLINLNKQIDIPREQREQAYAKLLEGQRYLIASNTTRSSANSVAAGKIAKESFSKALELNPHLAEGYTALAELSLIVTPVDIEEAIALAGIAVKIQPDNFGAHRILARIYTIKSGLNTLPNLDALSMQKAISEWKELIRLDSRFAEAWAFLSAFYDKTNKNDEHIEALKKWQASSVPVETRFYRTIMGAQETLLPDSVAVKLGAALIKANRSSEAVEVLSIALSNDPDSLETIDLLKQSIEIGKGQISKATVEALQQAVFANPGNIALIELLASVQSRSGKTDEAVVSLRNSISNIIKTDKSSAASLQISLGDIYANASRNDEAVAAYEEALKIQGIDKAELTTDDDREFATRVFGKMIQVYKNAGKIAEAKALIERARLLLGKDDLFADKQSISLLRETGNKQGALQSVRNLRQQTKDDYSLLRLEATLLTDLGKVDEGVKLIKTLIKPASQVSKLPPSPFYDDFTNYVFISSLYNQAKRGNEAVESARLAFTAADSEEKKQIANLSLAAAQQTAGNYKLAEEILRNLLKRSPGNPVALNNLGYFLLERNERLDEAITLIKQAVNIDPTNASYLDSLGWAYFKTGKFNEAEQYLKEAARGESPSAAVFEHLGDLYLKLGKHELAKSTWQRAIDISSDSELENRLKEKIASRNDK